MSSNTLSAGLDKNFSEEKVFKPKTPLNKACNFGAFTVIEIIV